jgi:acetoin utilization deacetylase AcuC-like enzyme
MKQRGRTARAPADAACGAGDAAHLQRVRAHRAPVHLVVVFYSPRYHVNIGPHVFPTLKYLRVAEQLRRDLASTSRFVEPEPASWQDRALVHTPEYIHKLQTGALTADDLAQLELPWSPEVVEGFRLMTGGTIAAARLALSGSEGAVVAHIGGGLHHAFPNHGEGFCVFHDVAVAIHVLFRDRLASTAAVVDLDVHHGNGTSFIFERDPRVFTFSIHQQHNYPMHKPRSSLDIGLPDRTGDREYLDRLETNLPKVFEAQPDVVFYLAGADPFEDDQLGGLSLTKAGLAARDRMVVDACRARDVQAVVVLAGGYARRLADTVDIHCTTISVAASPPPRSL